MTKISKETRDAVKKLVVEGKTAEEIVTATKVSLKDANRFLRRKDKIAARLKKQEASAAKKTAKPKVAKKVTPKPVPKTAAKTE